MVGANIDPGDHWANFGDGNMAQIIETKQMIKKGTGDKIYRFILKPSRRIESMYDIKGDQDENGLIIKEYHWSDVVFLERGVGRTRCWIFTDFLGNSTPASRRHEDLRESLQDAERLLRSAKAAKHRAMYELTLERQDKARALKYQIDIIKEVAKARGKSDDEDGGQFQDE